MGRYSLPAKWRLLAVAALCLALSPARAFAAAPAQQITYSYERTECPEDEDGWYDVRTVNADGTSSHDLTLDGRYKDQSWALDGSRMVALAWDRHPVLFHPRQLVTMRADGSDAQVLTAWPRSITDVAWSPVSSAVMVVADHDSNTNIGRIVYYNVKTGSRTVLYTVKSIIIDMAWSPDGTKVLFVQRLKGVDRTRLLSVPSRTISATPVGNANANAVSWSTTTGEQAYATQASIWIVAPGGGTRTVATFGSVGGISWSPDASALTFDGRQGDGTGIFTVNRDGTGLKQLNQDNRLGYGQRDTAFDPTWRPVVARTAPRFAVTFPASCDYYGPEEITYTLLAEDGSPLAGRTVTLQSSSDGMAWKTMATRATDSAGRVSTWAKPTKLRYYRAFFAGDAGNAQTISAIGSIKPRVAIGRPKTPSSVSKGAYFRVSGTLRPYHKPGSTRTSPVRIYFYRWETDGNGDSDWVLRRIATAECKKSRTGMTYKTNVSLPFRGRWAARAYHPADDLHSPTYSAERRLTVK